MRLRIDKIAPALKEDGSQDGYGEGARWSGAYFMDCTRLDKNEPYYAKGNFKKPPAEGAEEDFVEKPKRDDPTRSICFKSSPLVEFSDGSYQPHGPEVWRMVVVRPARDERPNPYAEQGSKYAAKPASGPANAPQGPSRAMPTVTERAKELFALLPRAIDGVTTVCNAKVLDASPGDILQASISVVMHLLIGIDQGRIAPMTAPSAPAPAAPAPTPAPKPVPQAAPVAPAGYAPSDDGEPEPDENGRYPDLPF